MNERYYRQIPILGKEGQHLLERSSVLVIGAGGVGSPLLMYLAGAGIGSIGLIDFDSVDLTNLHRQVLFKERDIGKNKAEQGAIYLNELNSNIKIQAYPEKLSIDNANHIFSKYDLIIDGSDNFQTRYLTNDVCCQLGLSFISISIYQSQIQIVTIDPKRACYRCAFPEPPPPTLVQSCSLSGIVGATAGIAGSLGAAIAIQMITGSTSLPLSHVIKVNSNDFSIQKFEINEQLDCMACCEKLISWPAISYSIKAEEINLDDYLVVDLREPSEDRSIILSSRQMNLSFSELVKNPCQLPKIKILLYCSKGIRSEYAAYLLRNQGIEAFSLQGFL